MNTHRTSATAPFSVCVYCGARDGSEPAFIAAAQEVGRLIAERGWQLVYGGGRSGLMGATADAALSAGGRVVGIIPQSLMDREHGHTGLNELHVVRSMHERKQMMAERADAFLALPGGIGTLEELFETWTWRQLGYHDKPLALLNVSGYYDGLMSFVGNATAKGFLSEDQLALVSHSSHAPTLLDALREQSRHTPTDYSQT